MATKRQAHPNETVAQQRHDSERYLAETRALQEYRQRHDDPANAPNTDCGQIANLHHGFTRDAVCIQKNKLHQFSRFLSAGMGSVHEHHTGAVR